uniref:protein-disulfide reductase n=1 Tax=Panagrellus redivivus TaxID=6233 RepID=A0A7E4W441_PANRE
MLLQSLFSTRFVAATNFRRMSTLFANIPLKRKGGQVVNADALQGKTVALYFSAHWCPPCRNFTPVLKEFYEEGVNGGLEIVFISFDRSASDQEAYLNESHGNWLYIPHGDSNIEKLADKYGVSGIPALILIKADGSIANKDARTDVQSLPAKAAVSKWASQVA